MLVSSISTVLFNGNPLLRFDGYYILSDILEIPNLNQKSTKALTTLLGRHWLGLEIPDDQLMPANRPVAFAMFTVAAFCYRWFIMFAIITFLTKMLEPYGLESIGIGIALFSLVGMLGMPGYKLYKYMSVPGRMHQVKKTRFSVILASALFVVGLILFLPLPHYLRCSMIVMPQEIETIWVDETGKLESCDVVPGQTVTKGQTLARLSNIDLELQLLATKGQLTTKLHQQQQMRGAAGTPGARMDGLNALTGEIANLKVIVKDIERRVGKMTLTSPIDGTVLETPFQYQASGPGEIQNVDQRCLLYGNHDNVSAQRGQRFCEIADVTKWYGMIILTEHQIKFARKGQDVKIKLYAQPGKVLESTVESKPGPSDLSIDRKSRDLAAPGQPQQPNAQQRPPDLSNEMVAALQQQDFQYFARVPLPETDIEMKIGLGGQARLFTGYLSIGERIWWWINQNFRT